VLLVGCYICVSCTCFCFWFIQASRKIIVYSSSLVGQVKLDQKGTQNFVYEYSSVLLVSLFLQTALKTLIFTVFTFNLCTQHLEMC